MRLRASERTVELLKRKNTGHHRQHAPSAACDVTSCQLMSFPVCVSALAGRVCSTEKMMEELMKQSSGQVPHRQSFISAGVWTDNFILILIFIQTSRCPTAPPSWRDWWRFDWRS